MGAITDWGSTASERSASFPCDRLLADPDDTLFRAVDVAAPPETVFRWLCQLRAAPYSYDWIDNLGRRSPRELTPGLEQLEVGQTVCRIFRLAEFEPDRHITLVMHDRGARRAFGDVVLTYRVTPAVGGSRLLAKLLVRRPRAGLARLLAPLLPAGDLVMMRKQLLTLKALAEGGAGRA
jgi:Polyketide cyclase / dehydrase and lipid transport